MLVDKKEPLKTHCINDWKHIWFIDPYTLIDRDPPKPWTKPNLNYIGTMKTK